MLNLRTILSRMNEQAAEEQTDARETGPRGYRDPVARPVILANRIYKRRHEVRRTVQARTIGLATVTVLYPVDLPIAARINLLANALAA